MVLFGCVRCFDDFRMGLAAALCKVSQWFRLWYRTRQAEEVVVVVAVLGNVVVFIVLCILSYDVNTLRTDLVGFV